MTEIINDPAVGYRLTGPIPDSEEEQLALLQRAAEIMSGGQGAGAPTFDHAKRLFDLVSAFMQATLTRRLVNAHENLRRATTHLSIATWVLVAVTVGLGVLEGLKIAGVLH
jgi:hypothetical protein